MIKEEDYSIFNKEILGGIKEAVERGESLKDAMMTFYQAGYGKVEIENAAREFLDEQNKSPQINMPSSNSTLPGVQSQKEQEQKKTTNKKVAFNHLPTQGNSPESPKPASNPVKKLPSLGRIPPQSQQKVSAYGTAKKPKIPKSNALTITLAIILFLLLGVLLVVFVYKEAFVNFVNSLFG